MARRWTRRAALLTATGVGLGTLVVAATPAVAQSPFGPGMNAGMVEQHFIVMMIPHHEDAIVMAQLAARQAEHPEIRALAAAIERTQSAEIEQMRAWYRAWFGADVPVAPGRMRHDDPMAIDGRSPFDQAFLEAMVPHHEMGVRMATMALRGAVKPELRELLQAIIATQQAEIDQMRDWYAQWYGTPLPETGMMGGGPAGPLHRMGGMMAHDMGRGLAERFGLPGLFRSGR